MQPRLNFLPQATVIRLRPGAPRTVLPDVRCDLIWNEDGWTLIGPQSRPRFGVVSRNGLLFSLAPLVARALLDMPLREITDIVVPLQDISRPLTSRFADAAIGAKALPEASRSDPRLRVAEGLLRAGLSVQAAAIGAGLSSRQLERRFSNEFGLSPKRYSRITRFRRALVELKRGRTLAAAAFEAGYADQSHFTRDCQVHSGTTPTALRKHVANVQDLLRGDLVD